MKIFFINSTHQKYFHRTQSWPTHFSKLYPTYKKLFHPTEVGQLTSSNFHYCTQSWPTHFSKLCNYHTENIFIEPKLTNLLHRTNYQTKLDSIKLSHHTQLDKIISSDPSWPTQYQKIFSSDPLSIPKNIFIEPKVGQLSAKKYFHHTDLPKIISSD